MSDGVVHIIDDDEAIRDSLGFLLRVNRIPFRLFSSPLEFLEASPPNGGCILTDVRMPEMNGVEMVRRLKARGERAPVIVMTGHADVPLAIEAMKAGVVDFIEKPFDEAQLLAAITAALEQGKAQRNQDGAVAETRKRLAALSPREREVLQGLIEGHANKVIAFDLGISPRTVEIHRANLMSKMQARSLSELVRMALSVGEGGSPGV
ncbi:response regulator FixJ [uncultured Caulobacter sp.]|uniref:response regulator FixJ n=1 Tax=uncultured Caulobacter sp. TaxID=158749 RepID=UPI00261D3F5A|nr:response regulator FixJ [uncultured Caulobacter sp.]